MLSFSISIPLLCAMYIQYTVGQEDCTQPGIEKCAHGVSESVSDSEIDHDKRCSIMIEAVTCLKRKISHCVDEPMQAEMTRLSRIHELDKVLQIMCSDTYTPEETTTVSTPAAQHCHLRYQTILDELCLRDFKLAIHEENLEKTCCTVHDAFACVNATIYGHCGKESANLAVAMYVDIYGFHEAQGICEDTTKESCQKYSKQATEASTTNESSENRSTYAIYSASTERLSPLTKLISALVIILYAFS